LGLPSGFAVIRIPLLPESKYALKSESKDASKMENKDA
jgi:hypothetical protein